MDLDKKKNLRFLDRPRKTPDISNTEIILAKFPKGRQDAVCTLLLGTYLELVDREAVLKQKELLVNTVLGVLKTKIESVKREEQCHRSIFLSRDSGRPRGQLLV